MVYKIFERIFKANTSSLDLSIDRLLGAAAFTTGSLKGCSSFPPNYHTQRTLGLTDVTSKPPVLSFRPRLRSNFTPLGYPDDIMLFFYLTSYYCQAPFFKM